MSSMRRPRPKALLGWLLTIALVIGVALPLAGEARADAPPSGAQLFANHCAGCHVNGGNILRRNKTLKLAALQRQGIASEAAIAVIAAQGIGQMGGYRDKLGIGGPEAVASWVWQQAQAGWPKP
jgi:cytochrome c6